MNGRTLMRAFEAEIEELGRKEDVAYSQGASWGRSSGTEVEKALTRERSKSWEKSKKKYKEEQIPKKLKRIEGRKQALLKIDKQKKGLMRTANLESTNTLMRLYEAEIGEMQGIGKEFAAENRGWVSGYRTGKMHGTEETSKRAKDWEKARKEYKEEQVPKKLKRIKGRENALLKTGRQKKALMRTANLEDVGESQSRLKLLKEGVGQGKKVAIGRAKEWEKARRKYKEEQLPKKLRKASAAVGFGRKVETQKALMRTANLESGKESLLDQLLREYECATPGEKIRSQGKGKGLARGGGKGPIGKPSENFPGEGKARRDDENVERMERSKRELKQKEMI